MYNRKVFKEEQYKSILAKAKINESKPLGLDLSIDKKTIKNEKYNIK